MADVEKLSEPRLPRFLNRTLTAERAKELADELGFLGIYDLLEYLAARTDGAFSCVGPRVSVRVKTRKAGDRARARLGLGGRGAEKI